MTNEQIKNWNKKTELEKEDFISILKICIKDGEKMLEKLNTDNVSALSPIYLKVTNRYFENKTMLEELLNYQKGE